MLTHAEAYLHYIRRQNPSDGSEGEKARETVVQAYEFALKECGIDRESGEIWQEYIQYLGESKTKNPWEIQQNIDNLRKVYHRAVAIPLNNVESLWKAYDAFESAQNKQTAKTFLANRSPAYMTARKALRELSRITDTIPRPILPPHPDFSQDDRRVVQAWRDYLKYEEGNPLASDDPNLVVLRVSYTLKKCMAQMRHFADLWHYAATYHYTAGRDDEGLAFLKAGVAAVPKSFLLTFALAEKEEDNRNYADCHKIFDQLIGRVNVEIDDLTKQVEREIEIARGPEVPITAQHDLEIDGEESDVARLVREREERGKAVAHRRKHDVDAAKTAAGIAWVMYMRFARRAEGLKAARGVFGKARKSPYVTWHIFEASALMEYYSNKDSAVAVRIFELGLKNFSEDVDFVIKYLQFLLSINDDTNARALFERSALKIPADSARPLWDMWSKFEYMYGDLTAVHKLETRWAETFPKDVPLKRFAQRYTYDGVDEIALRDLGAGRRAPPQAPKAQAAAPVAVAPPTGPSGAMPPFPPNRGRVASPPVRQPPPHLPVTKRDRSPPRSPGRLDGFKRQRGPSPPPRVVSGGRFSPAPPRDRSPVPPPRYGPGAVAARAPVPPVVPAPAVPAYAQFDRTGLPKPVSWFIGQLPPARVFDGPTFRADDIMGVFESVSPNGAGGHAPPPPQPAYGRGPPARAPPRAYGPGRRY